MEQHWTGQLDREANPASDDDGGDGFCPECGQPLDLSRHVDGPTRKGSLEAYVFAIFGLFLVVWFGANAWSAHLAVVDIDHQIVDSWASIKVDAFRSLSDQERVVSRTVSSLLTERHTIQTRFDRDIAGIAFGVVTTALGVGTLIQQRREGSGSTNQSHRGLPVETLWNLGESVTKPFLRAVLMLCGVLTTGHLIRGEPPTLDLLNRILERTVEIIVTMTSTLS